jgi:hypothetical protein
MRNTLMRLPAMLPILGLAGCYSYHPLETPAPRAGSRVEAEFTGQGSLVMASQIGPGSMSVRGEILRAEPEALVLAITSVLGRNEQETFWRGEYVRIPLVTVARVQQRKFALGKTILFGGGVLGGLLAAVRAFEGNGGHGGVTGGGGGPSPQ